MHAILPCECVLILLLLLLLVFVLVRYAEMASRNSVEAVSYLQTEVSAVVQHADTEQQRSFQLLTAELFEEGQSAQQVRSSRTQLFDKLSTFFPASMSQPRDSLVDRVRIQM